VGEKDLMGYRLWIAVLMILLSVTVIPASAGVTKTTVESITNLQVPTEVSPDGMVMCDSQFSDTNTIWWKDEVYWRQDIDENIIGKCEEGISFECTSQVVINARGTGISTGICRFSYPDGRTVQKVFHWTTAKGETRADFERWN
jgi:hypothetical protein